MPFHWMPAGGGLDRAVPTDIDLGSLNNWHILWLGCCLWTIMSTCPPHTDAASLHPNERSPTILNDTSFLPLRLKVLLLVDAILSPVCKDALVGPDCVTLEGRVTSSHESLKGGKRGISQSQPSLQVLKLGFFSFNLLSSALSSAMLFLLLVTCGSFNFFT